MARIQTAVDDYERKRPGGRPDSTFPADRSVEISVIVRDLDGNVMTDQSLKARRLDVGPANADNIKQKVIDYWKCGEDVAGSGTGRSSGRRSSGTAGNSSRSGATSANAGTNAQNRAYNKAVREWAANQDRFSEVKPQGRIPNEVTNAFEEAVQGGEIKNEEWLKAYNDFHSTSAAPAAAPASSGAHAAPEPEDPATAIASSGSNIDPGPQDLSDDETPDPPMSETKDEEWGAGPRPTQFA